MSYQDYPRGPEMPVVVEALRPAMELVLQLRTADIPMGRMRLWVPADMLPGVTHYYGIAVEHKPIHHPMVGVDPPS